jgi:predicted PurR-regulated permease PerM
VAGNASSPASRTGILVNVAAFVVITAGLKAASDVVVLVLAALFLAVSLAPPVFFLQKRGVPFILGLIIVMSAAVGALGAVAMLVGSAAAQFRERIPEYQILMRGHYGSASRFLAEYGLAANLDSQLANLADPARALDLAANVFAGVGAVVANGFLILILAVFLLLEASTLPGKIAAAFGDWGVHLEGFEQLFESINRYLVMKTWISLLTGLLAGGLCAVVGVDFPVLWGVLAFFLNYVPNIGSIVAAIPPTLLALLGLGGGASFAILTGYVVINNVLGNIVEPRVMGQGLGLSPFAVLLSLVFWGWVLGPIGMLLSIPLTMAVKIAMESGDQTRWIAVLLGPGAAAAESATKEA